MEIIDFASSAQVGWIADLMREVAASGGPFAVLTAFTAGIRKRSQATPRAFLQISTRDLSGGDFRVLRAATDTGEELIDVRDPWLHDDFPVFSGGVIGRAVQSTAPLIIRDIDWSDNTCFPDALHEYQSMFTMPLVVGKDTPINVIVLFARQRDAFLVNDVEPLTMRANMVAAIAESWAARLELAKANQQIDQEIKRVAAIQQALLPDPIPRIPGLEIAVGYEMFGQAGGDLYDFAKLGGANQRWAIFVGDASGHGPSAAVVMAMVHALLHAYPSNPAGPQEVLEHLNRHLYQKRIEASYVTAFLGFFEPQTRRLVYASAGHPPPVVASFPSGAIESLEASRSIPLGIEPATQFKSSTVQLRLGQILIMYTDGITEARNRADEMFGVGGIAQSLRGGKGTAADTVKKLADAVRAFQVDAKPQDDQTIVALQIV